jgi:hypothetical protein
MPARACCSSRGRGADVRGALMKNLFTAIGLEAMFVEWDAKYPGSLDRVEFWARAKKFVERKIRTSVLSSVD